jgi:putative ABC transport system permease protein
VTFLGFSLVNIRSKTARSLGLVAAIAFAVMTVVTLTVVSSGLEQSASAIITVGKADFTVAQKGASDLLTSTLDQGQLAQISRTAGVKTAVGVLVETEDLGPATPLFIEIGIAPSDLAPFGVTILAGHAYGPTATNQVMLGWRAAANLGLRVGSRFHANGTWNTVTGIYSTGNSFGDSAAMFPLPALQAYNRLPGIVTMAFVKVASGVSPAAVARRVAFNMPELATIETASQFGRADLSLKYLQAAVAGSTVLAVLIGAVIVGNTMLLSLFERTREFGLLRAIGWTRRRLVSMLLVENLTLAVFGAIVGVGLTFGVTALLERLPSLRGVLHADYTPVAFWRALYTALGMTLLGSLYPAIRAARLTPLKALSYE